MAVHHHYLLGQMANFNRDRTAERQPHAPWTLETRIIRIKKVTDPVHTAHTRCLSRPVLEQTFGYWRNTDGDTGDRIVGEIELPARNFYTADRESVVIGYNR